ncbi:hypothetical protein CU048_13740 [Beijerinckiaceae bacterium]|nr:hypothetical protein CU048_13740 [Beijerinckiaceae bacterium]
MGAYLQVARHYNQFAARLAINSPCQLLPNWRVQSKPFGQVFKFRYSQSATLVGLARTGQPLGHFLIPWNTLSVALVSCGFPPLCDGRRFATPLYLNTLSHIIAYGNPNTFRLPMDADYVGLIPHLDSMFHFHTLGARPFRG